MAYRQKSNQNATFRQAVQSMYKNHRIQSPSSMETTVQSGIGFEVWKQLVDQWIHKRLFVIWVSNQKAPYLNLHSTRTIWRNRFYFALWLKRKQKLHLLFFKCWLAIRQHSQIWPTEPETHSNSFNRVRGRFWGLFLGVLIGSMPGNPDL